MEFIDSCEEYDYYSKKFESNSKPLRTRLKNRALDVLAYCIFEPLGFAFRKLGLDSTVWD